MPPFDVQAASRSRALNEQRGAAAPPVDPEERLGLLLQHLGTQRSGLTEREATRRLEQHGPNEITRRKRQSRIRGLARQFTHPLAVLLWVAAGLAVVGNIVPLAVAIVAVIVLNAIFAFAQELQAERAVEALQEFLPTQARVRRSGVAAQAAAPAPTTTMSVCADRSIS